MGSSIEEEEDERDTSVAAVVKLGGAAITQKDKFETLDEVTLKACAVAISEAVRRLEEERPVESEEGGDGTRPRPRRPHQGIVVVHGAGSFGHFQARRRGVAKGVPVHRRRDGQGDVMRVLGDDPELLQGIAETRLSVTKLNHLVVSALLAEGVPAVGMSPFGGWVTRGSAVDDAARRRSAAAVRGVRAAVAAGLVPVLHGDVVMDGLQGCAVLSGDTVTQELAAALRPERAVFLTNVMGVFNRPPTMDSDAGIAVLLREISVGPSDADDFLASPPGVSVDGGCDWKVERALATEQYEERSKMGPGDGSDADETKERIVIRSKPAGAGVAGAAAEAAAARAVGTTRADVSLPTAAHDVTGGIAGKVEEAGVAARLGVHVFITAAGTTHAAAAVAGAVDTQHLVSEAARGAPRDEDWLGTFVRRRTKSEKESDER